MSSPVGTAERHPIPLKAQYLSVSAVPDGTRSLGTAFPRTGVLGYSQPSLQDSHGVFQQSVQPCRNCDRKFWGFSPELRFFKILQRDPLEKSVPKRLKPRALGKF